MLEFEIKIARGNSFSSIESERTSLTAAPAEGEDVITRFVAGRQQGEKHFIANFRLMPDRKPSVWIARAYSWWWTFIPMAAVLTDHSPPEEPAREWPSYEMTDPFWGHWTALPYWAATTRDQACKTLWSAVRSWESYLNAPTVKIAHKERETEYRHRHALEEGVAVAADWDAFAQVFPDGSPPDTW